MTSLYDAKGKVIPCTVIEAGPCYVSQVKTVENDGYAAYQMAFDEKKESRTPKPQLGHFKKAGVPPAYFVKEFRAEVMGRELKVGEVVKADIFKEGDVVNVIGTSKRQGFSRCGEASSFWWRLSHARSIRPLARTWFNGRLIVPITLL